MGRKKDVRRFMCDFETTVYEGQRSTEVWAAATVEIGTEDVHVFHSIDEWQDYFTRLGCDVVCYFHNLKFDGTFILDYLLIELGYTQYLIGDEGAGSLDFGKVSKMPNDSVQYMISDRGQWYSITYKHAGHTVKIMDSLKMLPFSVRQLGPAFKTKHRKLDMEYEGYRYAGCEITPEEAEYIANDVLVVKEALEVFFSEGHDKSTIGSCCLAEFKGFYSKDEWEELFPNVYEQGLNERVHGQTTVGDWVRRSYKGGWCYVAPGYPHHERCVGTTADVNSLYPSMMHSESGNRYPVGLPTFWEGDCIPSEALENGRYYFLRVRTCFNLKEGRLPCIQIKGSIWYNGTEWLETSDVVDRETGQRYRYYATRDGSVKDTRQELTLTMVDYALIKEQYDLVDFEIVDGCWFETRVGIFDEYIDKYRKIKMESKGARRTLAKLFLNNLYGKMAMSTDSSFKVADIDDKGMLEYRSVEQHEKTPGYIPIGTAITSYARNFTIRAAQANYHGPDKPGFRYADTDSIHCTLPPDEIVGIKVHPAAFCAWKLEGTWDEAVFVRQKTYMEHVIEEDREPCEPHWDVKCAGMPERCKRLFALSMEGYDPESDAERDKRTPDELEFLRVKRTPEDFHVGLAVPGNLKALRVPGGTVLVRHDYVMHEKVNARCL